MPDTSIRKITQLSSSEISSFQKDGFLVVKDVLPRALVEQLKVRCEKLFKGQFETGIYPDEWHWREGISRPDCTREICNAWKSDRLVASVVLSETLGSLACQVMGWNDAGTRIAQDDVIWKPAGGGSEISFHRDSVYISHQFVPCRDVSVTVWCALDDTNAENGALQYCRGSHLWPCKEQPATGDSSFHSTGNGATNYQSPMFNAAPNPDAVEIITVPVSAGDCVLHHQDIWHGSGKNRSENCHRRAVVAHLLRNDVKFKDGDALNLDSNASNYIYGRYKMLGRTDLEENFFPVTFSPSGYRTSFVAQYCNT